MRTIVAAMLAIMVVGCGNGQAKVKGKLVESGTPVAIEGQAALLFYLIDASGKPNPSKSYPMPLEKDGSFELTASGGEMPPGTYLVSFEVNAPKSTKGLGQYRGRFVYPDSPLRQEVKAGRNEVVVNLGKAGS
ncbi:MAG: hypothetical protein U0744_13755 [Gemmataceae bacterium]